MLAALTMALALGLAMRAAAQLSTTTVQGTIYRADGSPASGTLLVSWPAFTTAQNQAVAAGSLSAAIGADGFVSVNLTPNAGALPAGSYYTVVYQLSDGTVNQEYWVVPAAGTAAVASVRAQLEPSTVAVQPTVTSQYVTSALSSMASGYLPLGGGTLSGPLMLNADPTAAGQAATKHYADQLSAAELPLSGGNVQGTVSTQMGVDKLPRVDVMHPDFAAGQPIKGIAVTNGSCTSNATIAISAPAYSQDGTQATAVGYCVNGTLKAYISFPGGGYTSAATVTITGGGTSGATGTVALVGAAGQADPTGTNDSSAAILNAVDYAQSYGESNAKGGTEPGATPLVYLPKGTYKLLDTVRVPCDLHLMGDGENATILEPATSNENALTLYAGAINAADAYVDGGSITNLAINAIGGHSYQATELELQSCAANHYDHVRIYGGGGRGLQSAGPGAERQEASDIEIDSVRWPLLWLGNENHLRKLNIAAPGVSSDNYCWSIADCVNGVYPNYQWTGGTLVSANGNGSTSSFYVKGTYANGTSQSTSPLVVGHTFTVGGTGNLDGTYTVTAVTNNVASDPSGACTSSSQCFEVQAASSVSGNATLGESTTATFTSGAYTMSVVSGLGFDPGAFVSGPGIPANTRVVASGGTTVTVNQAFTASESGSTVAAAAGWWPTLLPTSNAAATVSGANVVLDSGSIKSLWYAGAYDVEGVYGSRIQSFYLEGYPVNGIPTVNSDLRYGNLPPTTTLTGTLSQTVCNSQSEICPVSVASTQWFLNYLNDPMDIIGGQQGNTNFSTRLLPPDYIHGSTAASEVGNGVEKGQWEDVTGTFAGDGNLYITARDLSTSTAPAGTAWPAGTIVAFVPLPTASYGSLLFADNHAAAIDPPGAGWWYDCNDQGQNPCASWTMGSIPNELSSFTLGDYKTSAAYYPGLAGNITFLDNEIWGSPFTPGDEPLGDAMIKVFGAGGRATVLNGTNTVAGSNAGYDATLDNGPLADGFWDPTAADGSCANAMYNNLDYNLTWTGGVKTGTCMLGGYSKEYTPTGTDSATGATIYTRVRQFGNSYCTYDTPGTVGGHATQRLCLFGGPGNSARLEWDTWSGSAWTPGLTSNSAGVTAVHLSLTGSLNAQGSVTGASINGEITVDGTTYTTLNAAWNAAVSQASATGKNQTIRLGPGTFAVSATLTEPANGACVSVLGSGGTTMNANSPQVATTLTVPASLNGDVFFLGNAAQAQGCTFRDLNLLAQANATHGFELQWFRGALIDNVTVNDTTAEGILLGEENTSSGHQSNFLLRNVTVSYSSATFTPASRPAYGIHLQQTAMDSHLDDIVVRNALTAAIDNEGTGNTGYLIHGFGYPYTCTTAPCANNASSGSAANASYATSYVIYDTGGSGSVWTDTYADSPAIAGFYVGANGIAIHGGHIQWPDLTSFPAANLAYVAATVTNNLLIADVDCLEMNAGVNWITYAGAAGDPPTFASVHHLSGCGNYYQALEPAQVTGFSSGGANIADGSSAVPRVWATPIAAASSYPAFAAQLYTGYQGDAFQAHFSGQNPFFNVTYQGTIRSSGGIALSTVINTASTLTLTAANKNVIANAAGGAQVLTLPDCYAALPDRASPTGLEFTVVKSDNSSNTVTLQAAGSQLISSQGVSASTLVLSSPSTQTLVCGPDNNWYVAGSAAATVSQGSSVTSFNGRSGAVTPASGDYSFSQIGGQATNAQLPATLSAPTTGKAATATALAATPSQCATGYYSTGITASGAANCLQSWHFTWYGYFGGSFATSTNNSLGSVWTPTAALAMTRLDIAVGTAPAGCTTWPVIGIYDATSSAWLKTVTLASGTWAYRNAVTGVSIVAGHNLSMGVQTAGVGCTTSAQNAQLTMEYTMNQ